LKLQFNLNGRPTDTEYEHCETLAEVLRDRLNLTGTKLSCEVQVCGACTVLVDGLPVSACTMLAYEARGKNVVSIEGLAKPDGTLHPIQQAFID
jgi:carbon-monoxide dehydrogenase small subunit